MFRSRTVSPSNADTSDRPRPGSNIGEAVPMLLLFGLAAAGALIAFARTGDSPTGADAVVQAPKAGVVGHGELDSTCRLREPLAFYIIVGDPTAPGAGTASNGAPVVMAGEATVPGLVALVLDGNGILSALGQPELVPIVIRLPG